MDSTDAREVCSGAHSGNILRTRRQGFISCEKVTEGAMPFGSIRKIWSAAGPVYVPVDLMRYLVKARVKPGREGDLLRAIRDQSLGRGSIAGDEYLDDMQRARLANDGTVHWVEVCFCLTPLVEERPYWEEYFELLSIKDAHARRNRRDLNGTEPWACCDCDCTRRLEAKLKCSGESFLRALSARQITQSAAR
jgi:hypothetical protein